MNARRLYGPVVLALLASGGLAFVALGRPWTRVRLATEGLPTDTVTVTGSAAFPLATALSLVVVTGALAVLATRGRVRVGVGVLVVVVAVAAVVVVLADGGALQSAVDRAVQTSPAFTGSGSGQSDDTVWRWVTVLALVIAALLGGAVAALARQWPAMSGRYDAPSTSAPAEPRTEADIWKALDEGRDPTE